MVFIYAYDSASSAKTLEHTVRPSAVTMLQGLYELQIQINVHLVRNLL